jgi:ATP phosphoribosyltransferase regulatory subunit
MSKWMLPEYVSDVLPNEARKIEKMRRNMLDILCTFGYELVMPPLIEYLDSLLVGTGKDLYSKTFKLPDISNGKTMGIRADITPQIARIDAHLLGKKGTTRLCYVGEVLHAQPNNNQETRIPLQLGAEIFGSGSISADVEIANLMYKCLKQCDINNQNLYFSVGHAGFLDALDIDIELDSRIFQAILSKDMASIKASSHDSKDILCAIMNIHDIQSLCYFVDQYTGLISRNIIKICHDIKQFYMDLKFKHDDANIIIDIADIDGYCYHTGLIYNMYHSASPSPIAKGGRYDEVSSAFGRKRSACGFSINLRQISRLLSLSLNFRPNDGAGAAILAPWINKHDIELDKVIDNLRANGAVVIELDMNGDVNADDFMFNRIIAQDEISKAWVVKTK